MQVMLYGYIHNTYLPSVTVPLSLLGMVEKVGVVEFNVDDAV